MNNNKNIIHHFEDLRINIYDIYISEFTLFYNELK